MPNMLDANLLHVRGIGGALEAEAALTAFFGQFGECLQAAVRHRIDEDTGMKSASLYTASRIQARCAQDSARAERNTSWALVTFASRAAAEKVRAAS
jgi:hypothetical protein